MASSPQSPSSPRVLELDADHAIFNGEVECLVATFYENERPLSGLGGLLDWRFHGAISRCLRAGAIRGEVGECAYLPVTRNGRTYHLILAGAGSSDAAGERKAVPPETIKTLQKNLLALKLQKVGISRSDFGNASNDFFAKNLKGVPLWIVR